MEILQGLLWAGAAAQDATDDPCIDAPRIGFFLSFVLSPSLALCFSRLALCARYSFPCMILRLNLDSTRAPETDLTARTVDPRKESSAGE